MTTKSKNIKMIKASLFGASLLLAGSLSNVYATFGHHWPTPTPVPTCGTFNYERTDNEGDFENDKVKIDFSDYRNEPGHSHDGYYRMTIQGKNGWTVTNWYLEVADNNTPGWDVSGSGNITNYNPDGEQIEKAKAVVSKDCPVTPTVTPTLPITAPVTVTPTPVEEVTPTQEPEVSPTPTPDPADMCTNLEGVQYSVPDGWFQNGVGSTECRQFQYGGAPEGSSTSGGQVLGASTTSGKVLGASTMANTGDQNEYMFMVGLILTAISIYGFAHTSTKDKK